MGFLLTTGQEGIQFGLVDHDLASPALAPQPVMGQQTCLAPLVNQAVAHADFASGLFGGKHNSPPLPDGSATTRHGGITYGWSWTRRLSTTAGEHLTGGSPFFAWAEAQQQR